MADDSALAPKHKRPRPLDFSNTSDDKNSGSPDAKKNRKVRVWVDGW